MADRQKTKYPGVFFREAPRIGGSDMERVYYVIFKKDGKSIEEKVGRQFADQMTPAKANRIRSELIEGKRLTRKEEKAAHEAARLAEENRWTIDRLWERYAADRTLKGAAQDRSRYKLHIEPVFGELEPEQITPFGVDGLRVQLLKKYSSQTVKHILALLRRIIRYGVKKRLCAPLPFEIEMPTVNNQVTERQLTPAEMAAYFKAVELEEDPQARAIFMLNFYTGMRRGELLGLEWKNIDLRQKFVYLPDPKGGKPAQVPLNPGALEVLRGIERTENPLVFPSKTGKRRHDLKRACDRLRKRNGLPEDFRPMHGVRHNFASMLASSGQVDMYSLQKLLTHKDPSTTQRYAHLRDETLKKASALAGDLIGEALIAAQQEEEGREEETGS